MSSSLERRLRKLEWCLSTVESPRKQALPEWLQASLAAQGWQFDGDGRPVNWSEFKGRLTHEEPQGVHATELKEVLHD
jgi:hypothetical protein